MKKLLLLFMVVCLILSCICPVRADDLLENEPLSIIQDTDASEVFNTKPPNINAIAALVMDVESGRVLYDKNGYTRRPMASTTKIMTCILAIERGRLDETVTVSKRAASIWGSDIGLKTGDQYSLKEMLMGMMINSGNDAAIAVAEHIGGSVEAFLEMMNARARELGAINTSFKSPHGLDAPGHFTTPYDLALITRHALENTVFNEIVCSRKAKIRDKSLHNTNEMLWLYEGADGVKTGYTGQAGRCLVTSATREGRRLISVVLNSPTRTARANSSKSILDYAFQNYKTHVLVRKGEVISSVKVIKGINSSIPLKAAGELRLPMRQDEIDAIQKLYNVPETMEAPVRSSLPVGEITFMLGEKEIGSVGVLTAEDSPRKDFRYYIKCIFCDWFRLMKLEPRQA